MGVIQFLQKKIRAEILCSPQVGLWWKSQPLLSGSIGLNLGAAWLLAWAALRKTGRSPLCAQESLSSYGLDPLNLLLSLNSKGDFRWPQGVISGKLESSSGQKGNLFAWEIPHWGLDPEPIIKPPRKTRSQPFGRLPVIVSALFHREKYSHWLWFDRFSNLSS